MLKRKTQNEMLIDVLPENIAEIVEAVKVYKGHQQRRLAALQKEVAQKEMVKALVKKAKLKPQDDGKVKFSHEGFTIVMTPRDVLIQISDTKFTNKKVGDDGE